MRAVHPPERRAGRPGLAEATSLWSDWLGPVTTPGIRRRSTVDDRHAVVLLRLPGTHTPDMQ